MTPEQFSARAPKRYTAGGQSYTAAFRAHALHLLLSMGTREASALSGVSDGALRKWRSDDAKRVMTASTESIGISARHARASGVRAADAAASAAGSAARAAESASVMPVMVRAVAVLTDRIDALERRLRASAEAQADMTNRVNALERQVRVDAAEMATLRAYRMSAA